MVLCDNIIVDDAAAAAFDRAAVAIDRRCSARWLLERTLL